MKISRRRIVASSDYRAFIRMTPEELEESYPDTYYDYSIDEISNEVKFVYISKNTDNNSIGIMGEDDKYYYYNTTPSDGFGWYEVTFDELSRYLN